MNFGGVHHPCLLWVWQETLTIESLESAKSLKTSKTLLWDFPRNKKSLQLPRSLLFLKVTKQKKLCKKTFQLKDQINFLLNKSKVHPHAEFLKFGFKSSFFYIPPSSPYAHEFTNSIWMKWWMKIQSKTREKFHRYFIAFNYQSLEFPRILIQNSLSIETKISLNR